MTIEMYLFLNLKKRMKQHELLLIDKEIERCNKEIERCNRAIYDSTIHRATRDNEFVPG